MDSDLSWNVTLYFRGQDLDPGVITKTLGFAPTRSRQRGKLEISSSGREVHPKVGVWAWAVQSEDADLGVHVAMLSRRLAGAGDLRNIDNVEDAFIDVHLVSTREADRDGQAFWSMSPQLLRRMAELQLPVNWTIDIVAP